jgi:hypothetical protein
MVALCMVGGVTAVCYGSVLVGAQVCMLKVTYIRAYLSHSQRADTKNVSRIDRICPTANLPLQKELGDSASLTGC